MAEAAASADAAAMDAAARSSSAAERRARRLAALARHREATRAERPAMFATQRLDRLGDHVDAALAKFSAAPAGSLASTLRLAPGEDSLPCPATVRGPKPRVPPQPRAAPKSTMQLVVEHLRASTTRPSNIPGAIESDDEERDLGHGSGPQTSGTSLRKTGGATLEGDEHLDRENIASACNQQQGAGTPALKTGRHESTERHQGPQCLVQGSLEVLSLEENLSHGGRMNAVTLDPDAPPAMFDNFCLDESSDDGLPDSSDEVE